MRIYLAGPMTGLPEDNYPAFNHAAAAWRNAGWDVDNPAEHFGGDHGRTYAEYVEVDLASLKACDAIAMLPGWNSPTARGSVWEHYVARDVLGLLVYDATKPEAPPGPRRYMPESVIEWIEQSIPLRRNPATGAIERIQPDLLENSYGEGK